jgi:hypothetical protein
MSTIIPTENDRTDPTGRLLVPARHHDIFRYREVWAVYRFQAACRAADARCSEFIGVNTARTTADDLNRARLAGQTHYYRVYRLAHGHADSI